MLSDKIPEKSNILLVTQLFPNIENSFLGTFVYNQITELKKYYRVVVIVPYIISYFKQQPKIYHEKNLEVHYIRHYPIWLSILKIFKFIDQDTYHLLNKKNISRKILKKSLTLHKQNHFIFVHGHEVYIGDEAASIGKILKIPSIITIAGLYNHHLSSFGINVMNLVRTNLIKADQLITLSNLARKSYLEILPGKDIKILPYGFNQSMKTFSSLPAKWANLIKNKVVILGVGFFSREKSYLQVIEAINHIKNKISTPYVVLLIGKGDQRRKIEELIINNKLDKNIFIVGEVTPKDIGAFYQCCHFLVHPSVSESLSMVCIETMIFGKPFICSSNAGISDFVTNQKEAIVIEPNNQQQLADSMFDLLINNEKREAMGKNALVKSADFFSENIGKELYSIYDNVIDKFYLTNN